MTDAVTLALSGLGIGSVYALVALGFSFIVKTTNSFNFAQGTLVPIGSLLSYTAFMVWGLPAGVTVLFVVIVVGILGGVIERLAVFPLVRRGDPPLLWLMSTLGVSIILTGVATRIWGSVPLGVEPYFGEKVVRLGDAYVASAYVIAFVAAVVVAASLWIIEGRTRWGRLMRAVADNRDAVRLAGVNVLKYSLLSYAVGGALAGFAGFVIAPVTYATTSGGFTFTILGFAAMAVGGFGNHWGALIGGWIVGLVQSVGGLLIGLQYQSLLVFAVLLVVLLLRPAGLFATRSARVV
ncbi:branched-chain amino acid ABC transporter permease [Microbacterium lushaniae]|nr:branched-chain amino acid ABC transporter permease [Microbacterium lushaniae]KAA9150596.1 branched-chain amino acid ABC transporter permease [Microbacterium lushaniae]